MALIVFAFAFDGLTAIGRGLYGYSAVSASRYTTYDLLALVGAYLVVVSQPSRGSRRAMSEDVHTGFVGGFVHRDGRRVAATLVRALPALVMACVVIQVVFGYYNGLSGGRDRHRAALDASEVIRHYQDHLGAHDNDLFLVTYQSIPEAVRLIRLAERDRLGMFVSP